MTGVEVAMHIAALPVVYWFSYVLAREMLQR